MRLDHLSIQNRARKKEGNVVTSLLSYFSGTATLYPSPFSFSEPAAASEREACILEKKKASFCVAQRDLHFSWKGNAYSPFSLKNSPSVARPALQCRPFMAAFSDIFVQLSLRSFFFPPFKSSNSVSQPACRTFMTTFFEIFVRLSLRSCADSPRFQTLENLRINLRPGSFRRMGIG